MGPFFATKSNQLSSVARAEFDLREMERDKVNDFVVNGKINKLIKLLSNRGSHIVTLREHNVDEPTLTTKLRGAYKNKIEKTEHRSVIRTLFWKISKKLRIIIGIAQIETIIEILRIAHSIVVKRLVLLLWLLIRAYSVSSVWMRQDNGELKHRPVEYDCLRLSARTLSISCKNKREIVLLIE
ncbi:hypothetical protein AtNW77_Chr5g0152631 [Arabidopsis thaliana]|uniref:Uncharacterized protein n=2 Tax=Arabidopsis thaliana TaxID=3702 RepID=A0A654GEG9_ARATH|nr:uncharacterized protein AT5G65610 [Arabidopsis thaliana]AED98077.2 hypothetical protein AT5G65610 [Arabidopsis thaliana]CAA0412255.1 unnamed protein product [Arabidopsis thaliana]VYS71511.1 unnamed protein product [Arabidopsis thaliana]|eukprot:NP_001318884.1 hypothetical protein AT5G65610 [Arabidopsis thaliana]